jgi:hypothetical protein
MRIDGARLEGDDLAVLLAQADFIALAMPHHSIGPACQSRHRIVAGHREDLPRAIGLGIA